VGEERFDRVALTRRAVGRHVLAHRAVLDVERDAEVVHPVVTAAVGEHFAGAKLAPEALSETGVELRE
jgi:hypothetical protein